MLCILIEKYVKKRFLIKKAGLFRAYHIDYELYSTSFGEICIYRLYYSKKRDKAVKRLKELTPFNIYDTGCGPFPEYIKKVSILSAVNQLKKNPRLSVYADFDNLEKDEIISLLKNSAQLILPFELSKTQKNEIFTLCGTLPVFSQNTASDLCLSGNIYPQITLPQELHSICPKEFSPLAFASFLYKENGRLVF